MNLFVSHFSSRLDAKGRVSIPAAFRSTLKLDGHEGLFVHPSLDSEALDAGGNGLVGEITTLLSSLSPYSDERDQFSLALLGLSEILKIDGEGRIVLSDSLKSHACISSDVTFVGVGLKFQLWETERFRAHMAAARTRVKALKRELGGLASATGAAS